MRKALNELQEIFELIPSDTQAANEALTRFKKSSAVSSNPYIKAKTALVTHSLAQELAPYGTPMLDDKLLHLFIKTKNYDEACWSLLMQGDFFFYRGELAQGENCLTYIRENLLDKISGDAEFTYLVRLAHVCNAKKEYAQRMYVSMQGLEKMKQVEVKSNWWYANYTAFCIVIADTHFRNGQFNEAWNYLQEALEIERTHPLSTHYRHDIYHNVATYYSVKEDNNSSIEWYEKAIALLKSKDQNHPNLIGLYYLISYCYYLLYHQIPTSSHKARTATLDKMEQSLNHCEKIIAGLSSPIHKAHLQSSQSRLQLLKKNYKEAARLLDESLPVHEKFNHLVGMMEYYHIGHRVYAEWSHKTKDYKKLATAYDYLEKYNRLLTDNAKKTTQAKLDVVRAIYELQQKKLNEQLMRQQIDLLNKEVQLTSLNLHNKIMVLDEVKTHVQAMKRKGMEINQLSKSILQKIDSVKITEQDKNRFQQKLDEANKVFSRVLLEQHPTLTNLEVNMCGLFKTGMTDKELARLYGQSDKSYEQHRWRIKKKMKLGREVNLIRYLQGLGA